MCFSIKCSISQCSYAAAPLGTALSHWLTRVIGMGIPENAKQSIAQAVLASKNLLAVTRNLTITKVFVCGHNSILQKIKYFCFLIASSRKINASISHYINVDKRRMLLWQQKMVPDGSRFTL